MIRSIAVLGGDIRQEYLTELLNFEGFEARHFFGNNKKDDVSFFERADAVVFPLPSSKDGLTLNAPLFGKTVLLNDILAQCKGKLLLCDNNEALLSSGLAAEVYSERADFKIKNGLATAEGAVALAVGKTQKTLAGSRALVIGYGFIGKPLSRMLDSLGAVVTASARKAADLALIEINGLDAVETKDICKVLGECDLIFNTVPSPVIGKKELACCRSDALIIELASAPGGIDMATAERLGIRVENAPGLPGKTAPLSAAKYIKDAILNIFEEMGL